MGTLDERQRALRLIQHERDKMDQSNPAQAVLDSLQDNLMSGWDPSYEDRRTCVHYYRDGICIYCGDDY